MAYGIGSLLQISVIGDSFGSAVYNVHTYRAEVVPSPVSGGALAEAWWNDIKTAYRGAFPVSMSNYFRKVLVSQVDDPAGIFGEYAIPTGERGGTRVTGAPDSPQPPFVAAGIRLTVATRTTRPGQKRVCCLNEADTDYNGLQAGVTTALNALATKMATPCVLGAPALGQTLNPVVIRRDATGAPTAWQYVTGYLVNPVPTSQVSRKTGRGA